jgi:hypothetical protein
MKKKKTPPVDIRKVIRAAAEAALEEPGTDTKSTKRRLSTGRAVILGAGLVAAGRLAASARGSNVVSSLQERLDDLGAKLRPDAEDEDVDADVDGQLPEEPEEDLVEEPEEDLVEEPEEDLVEEPEEDLEEPPRKTVAARGRARRQRRA